MDFGSPIIKPKIIPTSVNQELSKQNTPVSSENSSSMSIKTVTSNNSMLSRTMTSDTSNATLKPNDSRKTSEKFIISESVTDHDNLKTLNSNKATLSENSFILKLVEISEGLGHPILIPESTPNSSGTDVDSTDNECVVDINDLQTTRCNTDNETEVEHSKLISSLKKLAATTTYLSQKPNESLITGNINTSNEKTNSDSITSVKINVTDDECGDTKISQLKLFNTSYESSVEGEQLPLYHASKQYKKRTKKTSKKSSKQNGVIIINNMKSKLHHPKYCIAKKLEKYQRYSKINSNNCQNNAQIKSYTDEISTVVSQLKVLKKMPAKVNLLANDATSCKTSSFDKADSNLTAKLSFDGQSSQNTLIHKQSSQLSNDNINSSVKQLRMSSEMVNPFQKELINSSCSVSYSALSTKKSNQQVMKNDTVSNDTFTYSNTSVVLELSAHNVPPTNSTFSKQSESETTSGNDSDTDPKSLKKSFISDTKANKQNHSKDVESNQMHGDSEKAVLLNTVMDLNFYVQNSPCTSSKLDMNKSTNNEKLIKYSSSKSDKDESTINIHKNVLHKPFEYENETGLNTTINLPNEYVIKADLAHYRKTTCSEEVNHPLNASMWDKMLSTLDISIKKMEDRLLQNVLKEIQKSLSVFELKRSLDKAEASCTSDTRLEEGLPRKSTETASKCEVDMSKIVTVQQVQCNIVQSQMIDHFMRDLSVQVPIPLSLTSLNFKKPAMVSDSSEIVEPTAVLAEMGRGEMVATSTVTSFQMDTNRRLENVRGIFYNYTMFFKENLVVFLAIPIFFVIVFIVYLLYGLVVLI